MKGRNAFKDEILEEGGSQKKSQWRKMLIDFPRRRTIISHQGVEDKCSRLTQNQNGMEQ